MATQPVTTLHRPHSRAELFWAFNALALQGFGGVITIAQRELVERKKWLTLQQFSEDWGVAQVLPGPNVINLSLMVGGRYFGWSGAACALFGILTVPVIIVLMLASLVGQWADAAALHGAMRGLAAVSAGMIAALALRMSAAMRFHPLHGAQLAVFVALTILFVAIFRWPLVGVLLGLGIISIGLTYWRLNNQDSDQVSESD